MMEFLIVLSRYLFIGGIGLFLWSGIVYIAYEQGGFLGSPVTAVSLQKGIVIGMHLLAFLILTARTGFAAAGFGLAGLIFLLIAWWLLDHIYYDGCPLLINGMLFLMDVGLIFLWRLEPPLAQRQLIWMTLGLTCICLLPYIMKIIPHTEKLEWLYVVLIYGLLLATHFFGEEKGGSVNWLTLKFGTYSFTFQPSEIEKFLFIFYLASVFRKRVGWREFLQTAILSAGIILLLVLQKDLGSALIFFMTYMVLLYVSTSSELLFFLGMGTASAAAVLAYRLFSHVQVRVAAWKNPWADIDTGGYQIVNSLFAITTWGFFGSGLTKGMPETIPVVESDCIFAAICEEFGSFFGLGLIGIFLMILYRGVRVALDSARKYHSLIAMGVTVLLTFQAFLIIGGVIKLIPLTGVTLPLVSYGGSSILSSMIMFGILQWICVLCEEDAREKEERDRIYE